MSDLSKSKSDANFVFVGVVRGPSRMLLPVPPRVMETLGSQVLAGGEDVTAALDGLIFDALDALLVVLKAHGSLHWLERPSSELGYC